MHKRRKTLVDPLLQGKFVLAFLAVSASGIALFAIALSLALRSYARELPYESELVTGGLHMLMWQKMWLSLIAAVPLSIGVGTLLTFRIAGPMYRFRRFLESVERGERPSECVIRKHDELHDFCEILNRVTEPLRRPVEVEDAEQDGAPADEARPLDRRRSA